MSVLCVDSSVVVAAMVDSEAFHLECRSLIRQVPCAIYAHGIAEIFATLTGGGMGFRMDAAQVQAALEAHYVPLFRVITLSPAEVLQAMSECRSRGVRGGAIYDYLHVAAAKKAGATHFYTLNESDFTAIHRRGDPKIAHPRGAQGM